MASLTLSRAKELHDSVVKEEHLRIHALNVMAAMGAMAKHFGKDEAETEHWQAVGYLHDYDYEQFPLEHLKHTQEPLEKAGVPQEDIRAILSHGWLLVNDIKPQSDMEKSLYAVDELTGIVQACARMRPNGITDLTVSSVLKKYKNKKFAEKCNREVIERGCELLELPLADVIQICIDGMKPLAKEIGLLGTAA